MVSEIVKDQFFLQMKSEPSSIDDIEIGTDLKDTLEFHRDSCVGLAANMIGRRKRIISFMDGEYIVVMYNPEIIKADGQYFTEEGCLSLVGKRKTKRYEKIKVKYQNEAGQVRIKTYTGWTAQIIQHEIDHCNGILI